MTARATRINHKEHHLMRKELKAPENFRAYRFWTGLFYIACALAVLLFIFFLVDGFNPNI